MKKIQCICGIIDTQQRHSFRSGKTKFDREFIEYSLPCVRHFFGAKSYLLRNQQISF